MKRAVLRSSFVSSQTAEQNNKMHCASKFHCTTCALELCASSNRGIPAPSQRDSEKWRTARRSHAWLAIVARICQLELWPLGAALWASLTHASPLYLSQADWLRAAAESGPGKRGTTFRGALCWIIQTVPVATISVDMFPHLQTLTLLYIYIHTHTPWKLNIHHDWWRQWVSREHKVLVV